MGWDGGPDGWRPPKEAKAAAEAAEQMAAERVAADGRNQVLADSIAFGFDRVALAIVAAAGEDAVRRYQRMVEVGFSDVDEADTGDDAAAEGPPHFAPTLSPTTVAMHRLAAEHHERVRAAESAAPDADLDDLLRGDNAPNG